MTTMADKPSTPPTFMSWLGRQVAHIKHAIQTDVAAPSQQQQVVFRQLDTQERPHPEHPNVTLRRTTIDEVILKKEGRTLNDQG